MELCLGIRDEILVGEDEEDELEDGSHTCKLTRVDQEHMEAKRGEGEVFPAREKRSRSTVEGGFCFKLKIWIICMKVQSQEVIS